MNTTLGKRIAALRREKGLKQDELAEKLGVSPQAVSKWENDQTCPDISILPQLAKILGISVDTLLTGDEQQEPAVRMLPEEQRKDIKDMFLRIVITSTDGDSVRVNIPLAIVEVALENGLNPLQVSDSDALKNIDLGKILNMVKQGIFGSIVHCEGGYMHELRGEVGFGRENRHYRLLNYMHRNCENYPTHELGPIAKLLKINRGNRMVSLTSTASKAAGLKVGVYFFYSFRKASVCLRGGEECLGFGLRIDKVNNRFCLRKSHFAR